MGCCFGLLLAAGIPRIALILVWLSGKSASLFDTRLWPLLGFFFLPYTTCGYCIAEYYFKGPSAGWGLAVVIIGVLLDLGSHGGGARQMQRR